MRNAGSFRGKAIVLLDDMEQLRWVGVGILTALLHANTKFILNFFSASLYCMCAGWSVLWGLPAAYQTW